MYNNFKLPIDFNNPKYLDENIIENLQLKNKHFLNNFKEYFSTNDLLVEECDISNYFFENDKNCLYDSIFKPNNIFSKLVTNIQSNTYTRNKNYLKDTQKLISEIHDISFYDFNLNYSLNIVETINNIKNETHFIEKYQYLEIPFLKELNTNSSFLQILSMYNLFSPILNLLTPIFLLFMPFLILIFKKEELSIQNYLNELLIAFKNNPLGKLLNGYSNSSIGEKCGLIFWGFLYIYQIYNSINYCIKFFNNIKVIHEKINCIKDYLNNSLTNFKKLSKILHSYKTYKDFNNQVENIILSTEKFIVDVSKISEYKLNYKKLIEMGDLMKVFFDLHNDIEINNLIEKTYYLNGYIDNIKTLSNLKKLKKINDCEFTNDNIKIEENYYPIFIENDLVTNSIDLCNNIIITGPNASGKTTFIKSILFNIIFTQQFGMGFYKSANINLFDKFFCYLNIPDTNDRDSLFQAEARICKNIIEYIEENKNENVLCIFDELYSGTNPEEAVNSSYSLLNYLVEENCKYIITTHFYDLCNLLERKDNIKNYNMKVLKKKDDIIFTYKINQGISKIKGASNILKKLNYPEKIIKNVDKLNNNL